MSSILDSAKNFLFYLKLKVYLNKFNYYKRLIFEVFNNYMCFFFKCEQIYHLWSIWLSFQESQECYFGEYKFWRDCLKINLNSEFLFFVSLTITTFIKILNQQCKFNMIQQFREIANTSFV